MGGRLAGTLALALFALPAPALAHVAEPPQVVASFAPASCGGAAITPTHSFTGEFTTAQQGSYVYVPFDVPAGTTAVRVKYCWDLPEAPTSAQVKHTLDLGLYGARSGTDLWGPAEFRGWGGSSHPDVTVSPEGFSTEAQYLASPKGHVPGKTTRGYRPGPIEAGKWAVELGVGAVVPQSQGDAQGKVAWRVEVELSDNPAYADQPYAPAPYDAAPRGGAGWYAGDMHVHAEHSALGDATMTEVFDSAFKPIAAGGSGLDFITLSDYVVDTGWGEIGRHQAGHPGKLISRSAEVITYRGHVNNHGSAQFVDYRTGPLQEWSNGTLTTRRAGSGPNGVFDRIGAAGGYTQVNHPTTFPAKVPPFELLCRGCSWEYDYADTDWSKVDAIEVATGPAGLQQAPRPGPNPFTPLAIQFYEDALASGAHIAAVGSSDSHNANRTPNAVTQSPIGQATTVVYADELSEEGIQRGVEAGHTYVKNFGNDGPDLRFEARSRVSGDVLGIMGDTVAGPVDLRARVIGGAPGLSGSRPGSYQLLVVRNGVTIAVLPVASGDQAFDLPGLIPGRYRLQLQRGTTIEAVSTPIWVE